MESSLSRSIKVVAFAQIVPLILYPWSLKLGSLVFVLILALLCAFLGWALLQRKVWGRTLTIFVQGFNIIIRIITFWANVYAPAQGLDAALLVTYAISVALSWVILSYVDRPEVQLAFEA